MSSVSSQSELLGIKEFGEHLLLSEDLDPVYVALRKCAWSEHVLNRWLLAYWCFYDCGVASYIAQEGWGYWHRLQLAAGNMKPTPFGSRWRRAAERRHFRGRTAEKAVNELAITYSADASQMARYCASGETCREVMSRAKSHYGFGNWIGFKIADMAERVMGKKVSFDGATVFMFKDPVVGAQLVANSYLTGTETPTQVVDWLANKFASYTAPPSYDRPLGLQEIETILCKWKSHQRGHYPLYKDQDEIGEHLRPWLEHSSLAQEFAAAMPRRS